MLFETFGRDTLISSFRKQPSVFPQMAEHESINKTIHILLGEFDPGSERTLVACLIHASRTRKSLRWRVEWRTGE